MPTPASEPTAISLDTTCAITDISKSTWWRRIAKGDVTRMPDDKRGRATLLWAEVLPYISVPIHTDDQALILQADAGDAEAQDDVGQIFLMANKPQLAVYWFQHAAQQTHADAMQWLGHLYLHGKGVPPDENLGMMWIAKAAALGHVLAQGLMKGLIARALGHPHASQNSLTP